MNAVSFFENRSLFSDHYLAERLPDHPDWSDDVGPAFREAQAIYAENRDILDGLNEAQTENEFIRPVLEDVLGLAFEVQRGVTARGRLNRPDYILFPDAAAKAEAQREGGDEAYYERAVAVADAKYWGRPLDRRLADGREDLTNVNPSFQIVNYLVATGVEWGVLTNGKLWRLYYTGARSRIDTYYEADLERILREGDEDAFRRFHLFFRSAAFTPDPGTGRSFLEAVHEGSDRYGVEAEKRLKKLVFSDIFPHLASGFLADRERADGGEPPGRGELDAIYQGTLRLLYRLLFLLHAEARGLLPVDDEHGYGGYSLTDLKRRVARRLDRGDTLSGVSTDLWNDLDSLCRIVDAGDPALDVPRYDGGLFRADAPANAFLNAHAVPDRWLAPAIDLLTRAPDPETDEKRFIDYKTLDVEQLGSIYEGLLEFRLQVEDDDGSRALVLENDRGERKATGSYYTPHYIVEYIVEHTLGPVFDERDARFRELMEEVRPRRERLREVKEALDAGDASKSERARLRRERRGLLRQLEPVERRAAEALLTIRVCDPAMGSGHFLVHAVDWLAERMIALLNEYPDNPVLDRVAAVRSRIVDELAAKGIEVDPDRLRDTSLLKRMVMKRCIYGVDLNPLAVELAKLSLWLDSFTVGAPLSFLDHHLKVGNSLIGTTVGEVREALETEGDQYDIFGGPFAGLLKATELMREIALHTDATFAELEESATLYAEFERSMAPYKRVLDLWVSRHFGNDGAKRVLRTHGAEVLSALKGNGPELADAQQRRVEGACRLQDDKSFFHWELEFPEVFVDLEHTKWREDPGFDAVVGNPPYVNIKDQLPADASYYREEIAGVYGRADLAVAFASRLLGLVRNRGFLTYIMTNKFLHAQYGHPFIEHLQAAAQTEQIIDLTDSPVFEDPTTYPCILCIRRAIGEGQSHWPSVRIIRADTVRETRDRLSSVDHASIGAELSPRSLPVECNPLGDFCEWIREGSANGKDDVFILTRTEADEVGLEQEVLKPFFRPESIDRYWSERDVQEVTIWPYTDANELVKLSKYDGLASYVNEHAEEFSDRYSVKKGGKPLHAYHDPSFPTVTANPKIAVGDIGLQPKFGPVWKEVILKNTLYVLIPNTSVDFYFLLAVLNSRVTFYMMSLLSPTVRGGYLRYKTQYLEKLPIRQIQFTTPEPARAEILATGKQQYTEYLDTGDAEPALTFVSNQLRATPERSDVVHDLLAHLAERMIEMHEERQKLEAALDPFKFLDRSVEFGKASELFAEQIKYGEVVREPVDPGAVHHDIDGLRLVPDGDRWRLEARLKKRDPETEWREWQYDDDGRTIAREWAPVYRWEMDAARARYYAQAFAVLDAFEAAGSLPGGRTRSTLKKLHAAKVPVFDPAADLAPLLELTEELEAVRERIERTDALIDRIVYELYGLTEEEIALVEGRA